MPIEQTTLTIEPALKEHLSVSALEQWLWDAACVIRGATDAPKFKDFILPLVFYKRLSDVFDDEFSSQVAEFGDADLAREIIKEDHAASLTCEERKRCRRFRHRLSLRRTF
jgi:type I restriction enzyme M protein